MMHDTGDERDDDENISQTSSGRPQLQTNALDLSSVMSAAVATKINNDTDAEESSNPNAFTKQPTTTISLGDWQALRPGDDQSVGSLTSLTSKTPIIANTTAKTWTGFPDRYIHDRKSSFQTTDSTMTVRISNLTTTTTTPGALLINQTHPNGPKETGVGPESESAHTSPSSVPAPSGTAKLEIVFANDDAVEPDRNIENQSKKRTRIIGGVLLILIVCVVAVPVALLTTRRSADTNVNSQLPILPTGAPSATPSEVPSSAVLPTSIPTTSSSNRPSTSPIIPPAPTMLPSATAMPQAPGIPKPPHGEESSKRPSLSPSREKETPSPSDSEERPRRGREAGPFWERL